MISQKDQDLATLILEHSTQLQKGENVMVQLIGLNGIDLLRALVEQIRDKGSHPFVQIEDTETQRLLIEKGDTGFWQNQASVDQLPLMKQMDVFIGIRASENIYENSQASKEANKAYSENFLKPVHFDERVNNTKWCIMRYPSPAFAMNAKLPTREFTKFYYDACLVDYAKLKSAMEPLEKRLRATDEIHLKGEGTDIKFSVKGQNWVPCFG
ncbi:MAG TPA: aminopeptidase, partial [Balneola sp.]|nr:aminopeptidase [Balneola sp.]